MSREEPRIEGWTERKKESTWYTFKDFLQEDKGYEPLTHMREAMEDIETMLPDYKLIRLNENNNPGKVQALGKKGEDEIYFVNKEGKFVGKGETETPYKID